MIASGRYVTEIAVTVLRALVAGSLDEAAEHQEHFRDLLGGYPFEAELDQAMSALQSPPFGDLGLARQPCYRR